MAAATGLSPDEVHARARQLRTSQSRRGGARSGSGRTATDWAEVTGGQDGFGKFRGHDLLTIPLRLVTEGALDKRLVNQAQQFDSMMLGILASRHLCERGTFEDGAVDELRACPAFRAKTAKVIAELRKAFQHAIRGRAVKAHQARKERREALGDWYNNGSRGGDWDWRAPPPCELTA